MPRQRFNTYTRQFIFYFQKSSFMLVTAACQILSFSGGPDRALKPGSSTLAWPMKTLAWLLMLSWKEHRNSSHDHYYTILKSLSTLSNKNSGFLIIYVLFLYWNIFLKIICDVSSPFHNEDKDLFAAQIQTLFFLLKIISFYYSLLRKKITFHSTEALQESISTLATPLVSSILDF